MLWQLRIKIADVVPSTSDGSTNLGMSAAGAGPILLLVYSTIREEADELTVTGVENIELIEDNTSVIA